MEEMNLQFWIEVLVPPIIGLFGGFVVAFWQYRKRINEEKKVESLKFLLGVSNGWQSYMQSAANAITLLRNHIRGYADDGKKVNKYSSMTDIELALEEQGAYLHGLHSGVVKELERTNKHFKDI